MVLLSPTAWAQVTCSPAVTKNTCVDVADALNLIIDHGTPYRGVAIPLEIVSPAEYQKRLADWKEVEQRGQSILGGADKAAKSPTEFSPWYKHTLSNAFDRDITFLRDRASSHSVSAILISSAAFEGTEIYVIPEHKGSTIPGWTKGAHGVRHNGRYDSTTVFVVARFIVGYLCGTMATVDDGSSTW
jgi:hypothetical protein